MTLVCPQTKEDKDPYYIPDWIQVWFEQYNSWSEHMGGEIDHFNADIFNLRSRLVASSKLDGEQLSTAWGYIKLFHNISQYITHSLTTTVKTLGQRFDHSNKKAADVEITYF